MKKSIMILLCISTLSGCSLMLDASKFIVESVAEEPEETLEPSSDAEGPLVNEEESEEVEEEPEEIEEPEEVPEEEPEEVEEEPEEMLLNLELRPGLMNTELYFTEYDATIYTCSNSSATNGQFKVQIAAELSNLGDYDPIHLEAKFSSNQEEWPAIWGGRVYNTAEECEETPNESCEQITVGTGWSRYFEIDGGERYAAKGTTWCRHFEGLEYSYEFNAYMVNTEWGYANAPVISNVATLQINCVPMPCCPPWDYELGMWTVEPWECY